MNPITRPLPGDFPGPYGAYIDAAGGEHLAQALHQASRREAETLALVPADRWAYRYAPGKWTTKEVLQHIIDIERIFAYRALCFARNERGSLPGMDEDAYQAEARTDRRPVADLLRESQAVRMATIELFAGLDAVALGRSGTANGNHFTVPALGWIIAGHAEHHLRLIRERYLA